MFFPTQAKVIEVYFNIFYMPLGDVFPVSLRMFSYCLYKRFYGAFILFFDGRKFALFKFDYSRILRTIIRAFYGRSFYFFSCKKHRFYITITRIRVYA
jgi:hypothetical protein